jgi:hypothetical protein
MTYDYLYLPETPFSKMARALINRYAVPRNDIDIFGVDTKEKYTCCICKHAKDLTVYPVEQMLTIAYKQKSGGVTKRRYCSKHRGNFKPHSKRVGGDNF